MTSHGSHAVAATAPTTNGLARRSMTASSGTPPSAIALPSWLTVSPNHSNRKLRCHSNPPRVRATVEASPMACLSARCLQAVPSSPDRRSRKSATSRKEAEDQVPASRSRILLLRRGGTRSTTASRTGRRRSVRSRRLAPNTAICVQQHERTIILMAVTNARQGAMSSSFGWSITDARSPSAAG